MTLKEVEKVLDSHVSIPMLKKKLCGKKLGQGQYREVYELKGNPRWVVKVQHDLKQGDFSNALEWYNYRILRSEGREEHFAPCVMINRTGTVLIQRRITFKKDMRDYPKRIPHIFGDRKIQNYGFLNGRLVACDYALLRWDYSFTNTKSGWWTILGK